MILYYIRRLLMYLCIEWAYVRRLQYECDGCQEDADDMGGMTHLDGDTALSNRSLEAALRGAGSVCQAVDMVMRGEVKNAFCAVRPPGHHAGPRGLCQNAIGENEPDSHGFCLLNNISIGAAYAMNMYRSDVRRVAIVDFDVHHGNGTEETVRWLRPGIDNSAIINPFSVGSISTPRFKPWYDSNDADNVLFVSVHGFGPRERGLEAFPKATFYPGTGRTAVPEMNQLSGDKGLLVQGEKVNISTEEAPREFSQDEAQKDELCNENGAKGTTILDDLGDDDDDDSDDDNFDPDLEMEVVVSENGDADYGDDTMRSKYILPSIQKKFDIYDVSTGALSSYADPLILDVGIGLPSPDMTSASYRHQWRDYFRDIIFPRLVEFKPDLIMLSAGFDAHKKDTINSGYIALVEEDYDWITRNILHIANTTCGGRVVSALEGGYQINGEFSSAFARSVKTHVSCLSKASLDDATYSNHDAELESKYEAKVIEDIRVKQVQKAQMLEQQRTAMREAAVAAALKSNSHAAHQSNPYAPAIKIINDAPAEENDTGESSRKRRRAAAKVSLTYFSFFKLFDVSIG